MAACSGASAEDPKGLYSTLGVDVKADVSEIRRAYRRLALRWHPDKNQDDPSATAQFQQISSAYEVLSDAERRALYDNTGCIDAEEAEAADAEHAADIFASFLFRGFDEDLDPEEQAMLDEFMRLAGAGTFKRSRGRGGRKKGRGSRGGKSAKSRSSRQQMAEEAMMAEVMAAVAGMTVKETETVPVCPAGHQLKRRKAEAEYECDLCGRDILVGKRVFECKKCDWCMCQKCRKVMEESEAEEEEALEEGELIEVFAEMHTQPVRQGTRLRYQCELCRAVLPSHEKVLEHMAGQHEDAIMEFAEEANLMMGAGDPDEAEFAAFLGAMGAMPDVRGGMPMPGEFEAMLSGGLLGGDLEDLMMAGMLNEPSSHSSGRSKGSRRSKKKR
mmetsp:Transcript_158483/g.279764  ORF Transcript_158483/g.279764 Transcript_158483/m.279764 type:complete len:386 (+) Transcript_158483:54-1211(+)